MTTKEDRFVHKMAIQVYHLGVHKWILSERAGRDVGIEETLKNWVESGHAEWFDGAYESHFGQVERLCSACQYECEIKSGCKQEAELIYKAFEE